MKSAAFALSLFALLPCGAFAADDRSYSNVELGYINTEEPHNGFEPKGWKLSGSIEITPELHAFGSYAKQDLGTFDSPLTGRTGFDPGNTDNWRLGLGYRHALGERADLVARVAYERLDHDILNFGESLDGYSIEVGVRGTLSEHLESHASIGRQRFEPLSFWDAEPHTRNYLRVGLFWKFNQRWGLAGEAKFDDEHVREYFIGPRLSF